MFASWLEEQLPAIKADISASVSSSLDAAFARMQAGTVAMLEKYDVGVQSQFNNQSAQIHELAKRIENLSAATKEQTALVTRLDGVLAAVEADTPLKTSLEGFDRKPDITIVKVNAVSEVSSEKVFEAIQSTLDEMLVDRTQVALEGPVLGKQFVVRFLGRQNLAASRTEKFFQLQRTGAVWKDVFATGPQEQKVKLFLHRDKSQKQNKLEATTKRLCAAIKQVHPELPCFERRKNGTISSDYQPLARVLVADADSYKVEWNQIVVRSKNVDTAAIAQALAATEREPQEVQWG